MRIEVYRASEFTDVPEMVHVTFDDMDDRYYAAFESYPDAEKLVVAGCKMHQAPKTTGHSISMQS